MQAREELELSFVKDAEMVFTTLSSTGRRIFQAARIQFHTVLIDEAAQASELATLQAFAFGCKQCAPWGPACSGMSDCKQSWSCRACEF